MYLISRIIVLGTLLLTFGILGTQASETRPNVLFITMDDMNYDSIGSYGCTIPNISPYIDSLAAEGLRFQHAYNQTSSCVPSRNTYQNGRYPHSSGMLSFFNVEANFLTLPELMNRVANIVVDLTKWNGIRDELVSKIPCRPGQYEDVMAELADASHTPLRR